ncbi:hypothetical protein B0H13DRAFT_1447025, partial [Mycena leptocephala]
PTSSRLESIKVSPNWEPDPRRWMEAYRTNLGSKEAQRMVRVFSSTTYKSHRRAPERL